MGSVIMAKWTYDQVTKRLSGSGANIKCEEMRELLVDLGFKIKDGKNGRHRTYRHPEITSFHGGSYDCGHKARMLPIYPQNVLKVLTEYKDELQAIEKNEQDKKI